MESNIKTEGNTETTGTGTTTGATNIEINNRISFKRVAYERALALASAFFIFCTWFLALVEGYVYIDAILGLLLYTGTIFVISWYINKKYNKGVGFFMNALFVTGICSGIALFFIVINILVNHYEYDTTLVLFRFVVLIASVFVFSLIINKIIKFK